MCNFLCLGLVRTLTIYSLFAYALSCLLPQFQSINIHESIFFRLLLLYEISKSSNTLCCFLQVKNVILFFILLSSVSLYDYQSFIGLILWTCEILNKAPITQFRGSKSYYFFFVMTQATFDVESNYWDKKKIENKEIYISMVFKRGKKSFA